MGIVITAALGAFLLLGVAVVKLVNNSKKIEQISIAIAFGTMVSLVVLELVPDMLETFQGNTFWLALLAVGVGIAGLKILDCFIPDHGEGTEQSQEQENAVVIHIGIISAVAIILHNIVEGMAVYSITTESLKVGILVALGVGLHNVPMGMLMYATLEKETRKKRMLILMLAAVSTLSGGLAMASIRTILNDTVIGILISVALGMLLYIIFFELLPHLIHCKNWKRTIVGVLVGIGIIVVSTLLE